MQMVVKCGMCHTENITWIVFDPTSLHCWLNMVTDVFVGWYRDTHKGDLLNAYLYRQLFVTCFPCGASHLSRRWRMKYVMNVSWDIQPLTFLVDFDDVFNLGAGPGR
jgi:hypothetical protein